MKESQNSTTSSKKNLLLEGTQGEKLWAKAMIEVYGADHDWVKRNVYGEVEEKKRSISHKGALQKGKNFERDICVKLRHIFPFAERRLEYQSSKCIGIDIDNTDRFKMQLKCKKKYVPITTISEVQIESKKDIPVLITKADGEPPMAVLPFKEFVTLLEVVYGLREPYRKEDAKKMEKVKKQIKKVFETTPSLCTSSEDESLVGLI